eukprot:GHVR01179681.1.p1 GENE.GHVR01179681.1~~GHVR01179681.1.p1  ORF type:complete len:139 (-),score=4.26 GHVR01179681.1:293-709(-)
MFPQFTSPSTFTSSPSTFTSSPSTFTSFTSTFKSSPSTFTSFTSFSTTSPEELKFVDDMVMKGLLKEVPLSLIKTASPPLLRHAITPCVTDFSSLNRFMTKMHCYKHPQDCAKIAQEMSCPGFRGSILLSVQHSFRSE